MTFELKRDATGVPYAGVDEILDQLKVQLHDIDVLTRSLLAFISGLRKDSAGRLVVNPEGLSVAATQSTGVAWTSWQASVVPGITATGGTTTGLLDFAAMHTALQFQDGVRRHLVFT